MAKSFHAPFCRGGDLEPIDFMSYLKAIAEEGA